jgi:hypothetical protein
LTNVKQQASVKLTVMGDVIKFVNLAPSRVTLKGQAGQPIKQIVTITPQDNYPFKIIEAKAGEGKHIRFTLKELKTAPKPQYQLIVENLKQEQGRYYDFIRLKPDMTNLPEIKVWVYGTITDNQGNLPQAKIKNQPQTKPDKQK